MSKVAAASSAANIKTRPLYEKQANEDDAEPENLFTEEEHRAAEDFDAEPVAAKFPNLRREYTLERDGPYNHTMLNSVPDEDEWMNGVVLVGLSEEQQDAIDSTEDVYDKFEVDVDNLEFYGEDRSEDLPDKVPVYTLTEHNVLNPGTSRTRNPLYHERILQGIDNLPEHSDIDEETAAKIKEDFRETTYECSIVGGGMETPEPTGYFRKNYRLPENYPTSQSDTKERIQEHPT
jgi:hypothetical protein